MSAQPTQTSDVRLDPEMLPSRATEAAQVAELLGPGHAVVVVGHPGEGRSTVARGALHHVGHLAPPPLRCSRRTTAAQLLAWFDEHLEHGVGLLEDADTLPAELADLLEDLVQDERLSVVLTADEVSMRASSDYTSVSAVEVLNDLWRRRLLGRLDLSALPDDEIRTRVRRIVPPATLDVLQETSLVQTAAGSLALARDLAEDVAASPEDAPRLLPRAWGSGYRLSSRTLHRVAARFRDQPVEVLRGAILVHQVGPLGYTSAARVFGPDLVNRMEACGAVALSGGEDDPYIATSPVVAAGLLSDPRTGLPQEERQALLASLLRLHLTGAPLGEATALVLARHIMDEGLDDRPEFAQLYLQSSAKAARHGWASEAMTLSDRLVPLGEANRARPVRWRAMLLEGRHDDVLREAEALFANQPEAVDENQVEHACIAASWLPETPAWLTEQLTGPLAEAHPELALVMRLLMGDLESTDDILATLEATAGDESVSFPVRLWSLALCITRHMSADRLGDLRRCVDLGRGLRGRVRTAATYTGALDRDARLMFDVACCAAQVLAGVDPVGVERVATSRVVDAVSIGPESGRFAAASAAYLEAVRSYHRGDMCTARLNVATAMRLADRTSFASTNAYMAVLSLELLAGGSGPVDPEVLGEHFSFARNPNPRLPVPVKVLAEAVQGSSKDAAPSPRPTWAVLARAHQEVLASSVTAAEAINRLPERALTPALPASRAILEHLKAIAAQDPEALLQAAADLAAVGKLGGARHALSSARRLFLSHRQTARANDCAERLNTLPMPEDPLARAPGNAPIPAGLTQREYEVCLLVGEGLTNPQISERLFLSVRTVESHVLQARAKLRAPRRRDIPERLQRITQGRA